MERHGAKWCDAYIVNTHAYTVNQALLGANAAVTWCLRRVFLRSSSIKLASSDVSDSISLSQAVEKEIVREVVHDDKHNQRQSAHCKAQISTMC